MVRRGGIYKIQSSAKPERFYIGSAVYYRNRWGTHLHLLRFGRHHSKKLQRHFDKYGEADLKFIELETCEREELLVREQRFLDDLKPYFNCSPTAGSQLGFKHSVETCRKISLAKKGSDYWSGRKHTKESKEKMRAAKLGRKLSPETIAKLSLARMGNKNAAGGGRWRIGVHRSTETKKKVSDGLKRYFAARRRDDGNGDLFR